MDQLILKAKISPNEPAKDDMHCEKPLSKQAYFKHAFKNLSDSLKLKIDNGFGENVNYADSATS